AGGRSGASCRSVRSAGSRASARRSRRTARSCTSVTATRTAAARWPPTASSPGAASPPISTSRACRTSRSTTCTRLLLRFPEPYDFEISTERFRAFGPDLANLGHEGGLHRVVSGQEVRIEPAARGLLVEPLDQRGRNHRQQAPRLRVRARAFLRLRGRRERAVSSR